MKYLEFSANNDFDSGWISKDIYKTSFNTCSIMIDWEDLTGTLDGEITVEVTTAPESEKLTLPITTISLNRAETGDDDEVIQIDYLIKAVRLRYTANGVSGGKIHTNIIGE